MRDISDILENLIDITGSAEKISQILQGPKGDPGKNGSDYVITDKDYDAIAQKAGQMVSVPTKVSQLTNDSAFITKAVDDLTNYLKKSQTYTREVIDEKIDKLPKFAVRVVDRLPSSGISTTTIYLVPSTDPKSRNLYEEFIYADGLWEKIGSASADLTGYAKEDWVKDYSYDKDTVDKKIENIDVEPYDDTEVRNLISTNTNAINSLQSEQTETKDTLAQLNDRVVEIEKHGGSSSVRVEEHRLIFWG